MAGVRTLTVLVADVVASTELFGRLGVDRADTARRAAFTAFDAAVVSGDGVLIKTMGDGCLASFGSSADAVTAAVVLQQTVAGLAERKIPGLGLRVGVAVGDITEEDGDVFGPAVVTASRLCSAAGEHQILVTEMVRMLAGDRGGHRYEPAGELLLKGIAEPVSACTVRFDLTSGTAPRSIPTALAATPNELVVGRNDELAVLRDAFETATAGQRRAVLVAGEPGVGKTRLVAALAREAFGAGALVLFGRCEEDLAVAYQPFAEALRAGLADLDADVVAAHVGAHGGEIRRLIPAVDGPDPVRAEPALEQSRLLEAVTDLLARAADDQPVVMVLDDLHWAAPATVAMLRHLLAAGPDGRLCVLGTYRDTEVDRTHPLGALLADMHRMAGVDRLALRGLDGQGVEDLLTAASGDELDGDGRALAVAVVERTAGNPFFANQLLRHLVERGVLIQDDDRWRVHGTLADIDLPEGVLDVVGRRLSRLSSNANQAMAVAALGGLEFNVRVLCAIPEAGSPDSIVDGLDEAVRARLLVETGPGRMVFAHAIVRDTLDRELTTAKRARLHRALGDATCAVYRDAPELPLAELARHYTEAAVLGDTASAARWAIAAAADATDRADHRGAITVLEHALSVIETVEPVDQAARFDVAVAICERHFMLSEIDPPAVAAAADAARRLGSGERMLRASLSRWVRGVGTSDPEGLELSTEALRLLDPADEPLRALALAWRAAMRALHSDPAFPDDVGRAVELLDSIEVDAPRVARFVRTWVVFATFGLPGATRRLRMCDEALAVGSDADDRSWDRLASSVDELAYLEPYRGHSLLGLGRRSDFEANIATMEGIARTTGYAFPSACAHAHTAVLALLDGRFSDVVDSAGRMLEAAPSDENWRISYTALITRAAIEQGRVADMLPLLQGTVGISDSPSAAAVIGRSFLEVGDTAHATAALDHLVGGWTGWARDWTWPIVLTETTELMVGLSRVDQVEVVIAELESYSGELAVVGLAILCPGAYDRYRGMLLDLLGRHDEAVTALDAALALEESFPAPTLAARTRFWLAHALCRRDRPGDRERSAAELSTSIEAAERLGMAALAAAGHELARQ